MNSVAAVLAASRDAADSSSLLKCRAQRLAGMLHKLHFPEAETQEDLLRDVLAAHPLPAVALLSLLTEALDTRGVDVQDRLRPVTTLLQLHLQQQQQQQQAQQPQQQDQQKQQQAQQQTQQQLFSQQDLSCALLAAVALLPDWSEDSPKAPGVLGECVGTLMGAGHLDFGLRELAAAVAAAGLGPEEELCADEQPPLVEAGVAAPVLLATAGAIKAVAGEAAAKATWEAAGDSDLLSGLLPDWAKAPADVKELIARHEAAYLTSG